MTLLDHPPVNWVRRNIHPEMTEDEARCVVVACQIAAPYNLNIVGRDSEYQGWRWISGGLQIRLKQEISTFDDGALTRLVVAAHVHRVRVAIRPASQFSMEIWLRPRSLDPDDKRFFQRHPSPDDLIESVRDAADQGVTGGDDS